MKELYIHLGTHKTGTKSLQRTLILNRKALLNEDIHVIAHHDFAVENDFESDEGLKRAAYKLKLLINSNLKVKQKKIIICWEGFSGSLYKNYRNRKEMLTMIKESLPSDIYLNFILFLRRQDEFIQSAAAQAIHEGRFNRSKELLTTKYNPILNYEEYIMNLEELFPKAVLNIFPYDREVLEKYPIHYLLGELLSSNVLLNLESVPKSNIGMSKEGMEMFERISNKTEMNRFTSQKLRFLIQKTSNKGVLNEYNILHYEDKLLILNDYSEANERIAKKYWLKKFNINSFSNPLNIKIENSSTDLRDDVIVNILNEMRDDNLKYKKSPILRLANKINKLFGY
jgi:hypothetical protein